MFAFISSWAGIVMGIVALIILGWDLYMRRRIMYSELDIQERKLIASEEEKKSWQRWLEKERMELGKMYKPLSELIAKDLIANSEWAVQAIEKAKLGPYSQTLFGDRSSHFREEKENIASRFVPLLLSRCKSLIEKEEKNIYLILDSGTTLLPFFTLLGKRSVQAYDNNDKNPWIDKITIITNNLPGIETLMEVGRPKHTNRYSRLAVNCHLLPGVPLPIYSAVTGEETEKALIELHKQVKDSIGDKAIFIGITTGNWIRIRKSDPRCPIPLARGEGHLKLKQELLNASDELFVIAPLGKIFANSSLKSVNRLLGLKSEDIDPEKKEYDELNIDDNKASVVKLVTTFRRDGRLLQNLSRYIQGQLQVDERVDEEKFINAKTGEIDNIVYLFDDLPKEEYLEREMEFPHLHTRKDEFTEIFLHPEKQKD